MVHKIVRKLSAWAWQKEVCAVAGMVKLQEMHMTENLMEMEIKGRPELMQWIAQCFAGIIAESENYTEMKFEMIAKGSKYEWITVLVQKGNGKTPHQLRKEAEIKLRELQGRFDAN